MKGVAKQNLIRIEKKKSLAFTRRGWEALADEETMAFLAHLVYGHFLRMFLSHSASSSAFNYK